MKLEMTMKRKALVRTIDGQKVKMYFRDAAIGKIKSIDEEKGIIEAYVSIFGNVDSYGEVVDKGAFTECIEKNFPRYPKGIAYHKWDQPIAKTLEIREDEIGLYIKGQFIMELQASKEMFILLKEGVITDFSFGYRVDEGHFDQEDKYYHLRKLTIFEWSPVLVGANPKTQLLSIKSDGEEIVEEEQDDQDQENVDDQQGDQDPGVTSDDAEKTVTGPKEKCEVCKDMPEGKVAENHDHRIKKVISQKNRKSIEDAISGMKSVVSALEDLLDAADDDDKLSVIDPEERALGADDRRVVKSIIRHAKQADSAIGTLLFKAKRL